MLTKEEAKRFLKAQREYIAGCFGNLNDMQREAVISTEGPLLILAGAGSGKTTALVHRIAKIIRFGKGGDCEDLPADVGPRELDILERYLSGSCDELQPEAERLCAVMPAEPWQVIAITFTNKAANEMKERLESILGDDARGVWASTFHSACCRILRKDADLIGFGRDFTIYDSSDSEKLMKDVMKDLNLDEKAFQPRAVLSVISRAKDEGKDPDAFEEYSAKTGDFRMARIAKCYSAYQSRLRSNNALDFDDILFFAVKLLRESEEVRTYYQRKFRYVLIDEYQDTNRTQYLFASMLAGGYNNICVVGDDDQSIYRFRGATVENILSFEDRYKGCRVIKLEQNYRSTGNILAAANSLIKNNRSRKDKELWTSGAEGEKLSLIVADNQDEEAQRIASKIIELRGSTGKWSDFAVLYRMNAQSNSIEYAFKRNGIPYRVVGGMRFFDRAEIKDVLSYLCVIHNPSDTLRLLRVINVPQRGIGARSVEKAQSVAAAFGLSLFDVLRNAGKYRELNSAAAKMMAFASMIDECTRLSCLVPVSELYDIVLEKSGYVAALSEKNIEENVSRLENVRELKSNIIAYESQSEEPSLAGFLEEVALYTDLDNYDEGDDRAVMMTIHNAKGLEFGTVFVAGAEEGIFPNYRSLSEEGEDIQEERRLCYVAITRAKERLFFTCARRRLLFGRTTANRPSRFLNEIPPERLSGRPEVSSVRANYNFDSDMPAANRPEFGTANRKVRHNTYISQQTIKTGPGKAHFKKGDSVEHTAFGRGLVLSVTAMGNDFLLEVAFDNVGTKRLMHNTASAFMKKLA
ncbi:MAG: UvrD-helicase domain-containing protein [Clostridiales bacterium]|nr:UvrD-helicase domain-containing protein [Clostridiales bacterium]